MTDKMKAFLQDLAGVLKKHDATIGSGFESFDSGEVEPYIDVRVNRGVVFLTEIWTDLDYQDIEKILEGLND